MRLPPAMSTGAPSGGSVPQQEDRQALSGSAPIAMQAIERAPLALPREDPARAFEELLANHAGSLLGVVRRLLGDAEEARDATQDALVRAHAQLGSFRGESSLRTWVTRIAVHEALRRLRRRTLKRRILGLIGQQPASAPGYGLQASPSPEAALAAREDAARLARALELLPAMQRAALVLRHLEGLSVEEAAEALGVGPGTLKTHLVRALRKLRVELGER